MFSEICIANNLNELSRHHVALYLWTDWFMENRFRSATFWLYFRAFSLNDNEFQKPVSLQSPVGTYKLFVKNRYYYIIWWKSLQEEYKWTLLCMLSEKGSEFYLSYISIIAWLYIAISVHIETFKLAKVEKNVWKYIFISFPTSILRHVSLKTVNWRW